MLNPELGGMLYNYLGDKAMEWDDRAKYLRSQGVAPGPWEQSMQGRNPYAEKMDRYMDIEPVQQSYNPYAQYAQAAAPQYPPYGGYQYPAPRSQAAAPQQSYGPSMQSPYEGSGVHRGLPMNMRVGVYDPREWRQR